MITVYEWREDGWWFKTWGAKAWTKAPLPICAESLVQSGLICAANL